MDSSFYYINQIRDKIGTDAPNKKESKEYLHLRNFKKRIKEKIDASMKVRDYVAQLNITSTHLNRVCNALTGISASQTIFNYIISESKKYLIHSTFTISEIAYILNLLLTIVNFSGINLAILQRVIGIGNFLRFIRNNYLTIGHWTESIEY